MILPEDIEKQQFEVSFRGYNTREVDEFLNRILADLEKLLAEQDNLKRKVAAAELIAKDAKDHEEEFIASIQSDKEMSEAVLAEAKAEGERIIREAKNAAAGIMAEVRRRASDISAESRKASGDIMESAKADAEEIRGNAKADAENIISAATKEASRIASETKATAEKRLFSARTEADNILRAANTEASAVLDEAKRNAEKVTNTAARSATLHEEYIKEVRSAAEKLCFEIDTELKNSASRIALLGRRISSVELPEKAENEPETQPEEDVVVHSSPAHAADDTATEHAHSEESSEDGYFSNEYKQVMAELFGDDDGEQSHKNPVFEDDDTYDYVEAMSEADPVSVKNDDDSEDFYPQDDSDDGFDSDTVTSEYSGIPSASNNSGLRDIFADDDLDRVYKSPSKEDINDILNGQ